MIVCPAGEIDIETAPSLSEHLQDLQGQGHHRLIVDFTAVTFIDSSGLGALVGVHQQLPADGWLRAAATDELTTKIFTLTGLHKVIVLHGTVAEALLA